MGGEEELAFCRLPFGSGKSSGLGRLTLAGVTQSWLETTELPFLTPVPSPAPKQEDLASPPPSSPSLCATGTKPELSPLPKKSLCGSDKPWRVKGYAAPVRESRVGLKNYSINE